MNLRWSTHPPVSHPLSKTLPGETTSAWSEPYSGILWMRSVLSQTTLTDHGSSLNLPLTNTRTKETKVFYTPVLGQAEYWLDPTTQSSCNDRKHHHLRWCPCAAWCVLRMCAVDLPNQPPPPPPKQMILFADCSACRNPTRDSRAWSGGAACPALNRWALRLFICVGPPTLIGPNLEWLALISLTVWLH